MASKKAIERQKEWESKLSRAKGVRKTWADKFQVARARDFFDGQQNVDGIAANEFICTNKIYSHIKTILPSLYAADPYFYVTLRRSHQPDPNIIAAYEARGKMRAGMLNYLKETVNLKAKVRVSIQDAIFAYGIVKVHYYVENKENPRAGAPLLAEDGFTSLTDESTGEPLLEPKVLPVNEKYCVTRVHPDDFMWDEDAGPLEDDWKWVAQRITKTLAEVEADTRFNKAAVRKLSSNQTTDGMADEEKEQRERRKKGDIAGKGDERYHWNEKKQKQEGPVTYWEIYNLKDKTWSVIAENAELPLIDDEPLPPGIVGHPFAILCFTARDDSPYPIPPVSQSIDPQREYNLTRSRMLTHRKRFNRKYEVSGQVEDEELSKLESGEDGTCIRTNASGSITPIKDAPLDQATTLVEAGMLDKDITELFGGATEEARGIAGAESATQAGILEKRMEVREGDSMSMVIDFVKTIARKLDMLVQTHIDRDQAVKVVGPQGEYWQVVRAQEYGEIEGEYQYEVNIGSILPRMPQVERSQWMAFLSLLAGFPQLLLSDRLMKQMAEMHHIEDETMLAELKRIGQQMMSGQLPTPGAQGSQAGQGESRPVSAQGGQAGGFKSLNQPGAGNITG